MAILGRLAQVKVTGVAVAFTDEACTNTVTNLEYQITGTTKRVWDRSAAITVKVAAVAVPSSTYTINRLTGTVVFTAALVRTVTVTGSYLPLTVAATAKSYSYSVAATLLDNTRFGDTIATRQQGLKMVTGTISEWASIDTYFKDALVAGNPVVLEFWSNSGNAAADVKVWALLSKDDMQGAVDGLIERTVDFDSTPDVDSRVISA